MNKTLYNPSSIEPKWQKKWAKSGIYKPDLAKTEKKYYLTVEFTYTSGDLHMGHWFAFSIPDIVARFKRMQGYNVFFPNGFDAFGLPAENAAIQRGIHPRDWTYDNIKKMKEQFTTMGASYNWEYQVITCDVEYYRWNQWIFLKMFEKGLAYKANFLSNWCPSCQTVLANENVEVGKCWRCSTEVVQKEVPQWFLKITDYADRLLWRDPPQVDWPQGIIEGQNNWIGRSEGTEIQFTIYNLQFTIPVFTTRPDTLFGATFLVLSPEHKLISKVTTPENKKDIESYINASKKRSELERKEMRDKTGVFTGNYAINPVNNEKIPIWIADYVLATYGTGAIMGVSAHDQRDFEFAKRYKLPIKPVILPQREYVDENAKPYYKKRTEIHRKLLLELAKRSTSNKKTLIINGGWAVAIHVGEVFREFEDIDILILEEELVWWREQLKNMGFKAATLFPEGKKSKYYFQATKQDTHIDIGVVRIEDGKVVSLEPETPKKYNQSFKEMFEQKEFEGIPVWVRNKEGLYKEKKEIAFNKADIRWKEAADYLLMGFEAYSGEGVLVNSGKFTGLSSEEGREKISEYLESNQKGKRAVQYHLHDWSISRQRYWGTPIPIINCQKCGTVPVPAEDLPVELPYKVDFTPKGKPPLATTEDWINVKCPKCAGKAQREAETMDTFVDSSWYFLRYLDPKNKKEIFNREIVKKWMPMNLYFGGAEHTLGHTLYSRFFVKFLLDLGLLDIEEYALKRVHHGVILGPDGSRMSKSRGNVVNPDEQVKRYGADTVRLYLAFLGPYDLVAPWDASGINGIYRFLKRVWELVQTTAVDSRQLTVDLRMMHKTIKKVTEDLEALKFNTAIAALMEYVNFLRENGTTSEVNKTLLLLLAPFAPHMSEELWEKLGNKISIHLQPWPQYNPKLIEEEEVMIPVQVNGKLRDTIKVQSAKCKVQSYVEELARGNDKVAKYLEDKKIKKVVFIPGKLINFVIERS